MSLPPPRTTRSFPPPIPNGYAHDCGYAKHSSSTGVTKTILGRRASGRKGGEGGFRLHRRASALGVVLPAPAVLGRATVPAAHGVAMTITTRSGFLVGSGGVLYHCFSTVPRMPGVCSAF